MHWAFYPVFVGAIISAVGLSRLAVRHHDSARPRSLSELAAAEQALLVRFRGILLCCGALFAITLFGYIAPRAAYGWLVVLFGILMIGGELLAAVVPARGKFASAHLLLAQAMAVGMLGLACLFWAELWRAPFGAAEALLVLIMIASAALTVCDKRRYLAYELAFIFASHLSIMVAAIAFHI